MPGCGRCSPNCEGKRRERASENLEKHRASALRSLEGFVETIAKLDRSIAAERERLRLAQRQTEPAEAAE
jgi:hypothetical protein